MTCSKCTKSKTGKNNGTEEPIKRPRIPKRISKRKSTTTSNVTKKKANTATPEDSSDDLEPPQIENHATDAFTDEASDDEEESTDQEEDEDSQDEEQGVKNKKSRNNGKSEYDKKEAAKDVEKYRPLNYHGGIDACKELIKFHTGMEVNSEQMSSKEDCVFINLGFCKNNSPECTKSEKDANFGTWIRMTRSEIQWPVMGRRLA